MASMETAPRQIVAFGGGFSMGAGKPPLDVGALGPRRAEWPRAAPLPEALSTTVAA